jgi:hypothetical protein
MDTNKAEYKSGERYYIVPDDAPPEDSHSQDDWRECERCTVVRDAAGRLEVKQCSDKKCEAWWRLMGTPEFSAQRKADTARREAVLEPFLRAAKARGPQSFWRFITPNHVLDAVLRLALYHGPTGLTLEEGEREADVLKEMFTLADVALLNLGVEYADLMQWQPDWWADRRLEAQQRNKKPDPRVLRATSSFGVAPAADAVRAEAASAGTTPAGASHRAAYASKVAAPRDRTLFAVFTAFENSDRAVATKLPGTSTAARRVPLVDIRAAFFQYFVTGEGNTKRANASTRKAWSRLLQGMPTGFFACTENGEEFIFRINAPSPEAPAAA